MWYGVNAQKRSCHFVGLSEGSMEAMPAFGLWDGDCRWPTHFLSNFSPKDVPKQLQNKPEPRKFEVEHVYVQSFPGFLHKMGLDELSAWKSERLVIEK